MRAQWDDLPQQARHAVEQQLGRVLHAESATRGIGRGIASRLRMGSGDDAFLKAAPLGDRSIGLYTREQWVNRILPSDVPAPRMLWAGDAGGWRLLLFEFTAGRDAVLGHGSPDLPLVIRTVSALADALTPCPDESLPSISGNIGFLLDKAERFMAEPPAGFPYLDMYAKALAGLDLHDLEGATLLHADLKADNILVSADRASVIDWALACQGAAWVDVALFVPWLIAAGHTPQHAEDLAAQTPGWHGAPHSAVTGLAAAWTLFREYMAHRGPERLRAQRARSAAVGKRWVMHRMKIVAPDSDFD